MGHCLTNLYIFSYTIINKILDKITTLFYNPLIMSISPANIIPITVARSKLGDLAEMVQKEEYIILTKGGSPKAALVDIEYLLKLQKEVRKIYQKTFIDPKLIPLTREFSQAEISEWEKEDAP